jgi:hypothetical protein
MHVDGHSVLLFFHILLFGYWLGADLGVFFCDSQMTRDDLDIEERLRVRQIRYKVDLAPRTSIVLMLALGFTLALRYGSPIGGPWLALIWAFALGWLALIWAARLNVGTPLGARLGRTDRKVWWAVGAAMIGLGAYALATGNVAAPKWLALKMLLYGVITWNGIWIMRSADHWYPLIETVRAGGPGRAAAEAAMKTTRFWCGASAITLWCLVLLVAFLGTAKPF